MFLFGFHPLDPQAKIPKLTEPDHWGNWYRGRDPIKKAIVAYAKSLRIDARQEKTRLDWLNVTYAPPAPPRKQSTRRWLRYA